MKKNRKLAVLLTTIVLISLVSVFVAQAKGYEVPSLKSKCSDNGSPWYDNTPVIGVESAFGAELQLLLDQTQNKSVCVINGRSFTRGLLAGKQVVLFLSGGSIYNSALTTQSAFDHYNIAKLIFSGIAGGIDPSLNIGDVVIGTQSAEYMELLAARENPDGTHAIPPWFQVTQPPFEFFYPQPNFVTKKGGEPDREEAVRWFPGDPQMVAVAEKAATKVTLNKCGLDTNGNQVCLSTQPVVVSGNLVMGPVFVDNARFREWVFADFNAQALAMEEVYHACYVNQKPCLMLRSLSDLAGGGPGENEIGTFFQVAANNSAMLVVEIVKELEVSGQEK